MKKFLYFPSFDTGVARNAGQKNLKLKTGIPWRFWNDEYPSQYRHKYFLTTAGHSYKHKNHIENFEFPKDIMLMGDSGGFQIASGALKWDLSLRADIFKFLEGNVNLAMNLDIPPKMQYEGKFLESLELSRDNFKYFADNQSGKTDYLNIIQGSELVKYEKWYTEVKDFPFAGWSIGSAGGDLTAILSGVATLANGGEFKKDSIKWLHVLGASGVDEFLLFAQIQKSLFELGSQITVTTDSSTPSRSCAYGFYYHGFDFKTLTFKYLHLPRKDKLQGDGSRESMPIYNIIDEHIWNSYNLEEFLEWKSEHYAWLVSHNFTIFLDCYNQANEYIWSDKYLLEQVVSPDFMRMLNSVDELIKSSNPIGIFKKHLPLYTKLSRGSRKIQEVSTNNKYF